MPRREIPYDLRDITKNIVEWCNEVYPERNHELILKKLEEEFQELRDKPLDAWEMADIMIILFDLCDELGFDVAKIVDKKMQINKARRWQVTDQGILKHVKPSS